MSAAARSVISGLLAGFCFVSIRRAAWGSLIGRAPLLLRARIASVFGHEMSKRRKQWERAFSKKSFVEFYRSSSFRSSTLLAFVTFQKLQHYGSNRQRCSPQRFSHPRHCESSSFFPSFSIRADRSRGLRRAPTVCFTTLTLVKLIETDLTRNFAGFVASHVIDQLLELGYKVRGAARSQAKLEKYQKRWDDKFPQQFEFVEVPDILKSGAYDEVIKGKLDSTVSAF